MVDMGEESFMLISLDDSRAKKLADVLGSETSKKFIDYLAKHDGSSAKDMSDGLNIPMNTVDYNIKKLLAAELIQKKQKFFWSKKGRRIVLYELSNKSIIISPKGSTISNKFKSLLPAFMIVGVGTFASYVYGKIKAVPQVLTDSVSNNLVQKMDIESIGREFASAPQIADASVHAGDVLIQNTPSPMWVWFLAGGILALFIFALINWRKL